MAKPAIVIPGLPLFVPPATGREWVQLGEPQGFCLMVTPSRHAAFYFRWGTGRQTRRIKIGDATGAKAITLEQARTRATELVLRVRRGESLQPSSGLGRVGSGGSDSLRAVVRRYVTERQLAPVTVKIIEDTFARHVFPALGADRSILDLKRSELNELFASIRQHVGPHAAHASRKYLNAVGRWFERYAPDEWRWPLTAEVLTKGERKGRDRVLEPWLLRHIWRACGQVEEGPFGDLVRFLLLSTLRRTEVGSLHTDEVDADWSLITIPASRYKTDVDHLLPLSQVARDILRARTTMPYLFSYEGGQPFNSYGKAKHELDLLVLDGLQATGEKEGDAKLLAYVARVRGLLDAIATATDPKAKRALYAELKQIWWRLHDLRRTAATLMADNGVTDEIVDRVLGHIIPGVSGTYNRANHIDAKRTAVEKLAEVVMRIVNGEGER